MFAYSLNDETDTKSLPASGEKISDKIMEYLNYDSVIKTAYTVGFRAELYQPIFGFSLKPEGWRCTLVQAIPMLSYFRCHWKEWGGASNLDKKRCPRETPHPLFLYAVQAYQANGGNTRNLPSGARRKGGGSRHTASVTGARGKQIRNKLTSFRYRTGSRNFTASNQRINDRGIMVDQELIGTRCGMRPSGIRRR